MPDFGRFGRALGIIALGLGLGMLTLIAIGSSLQSGASRAGSGFGGYWGPAFSWVVPLGALVTFILILIVAATKD